MRDQQENKLACDEKTNTHVVNTHVLRTSTHVVNAHVMGTNTHVMKMNTYVMSINSQEVCAAGRDLDIEPLCTSL